MWDIIIQNLPTIILVGFAIIICGAELIKAIRVWKDERERNINGRIEEQNQEAATQSSIMELGNKLDDILDKLVRGDETVKWNGATYKVRCRVKKYNTFSSHLSAKGIIRYLKQHNTNQLVFHHGEKSAKANAVNITKEELTKIGKTTKVMASYKNLEIIL